MSDLTTNLKLSDPLQTIPSVQLDTIFASTEQALARAEESLRKAQQARVLSTSRIRFILDALYLRRFDEWHSQQ
jgi:hypothetical protein